MKKLGKTPLASKVYLLHYTQAIGNLSKPTGYAKHYLGSTSKSLKNRLAQHASGQGAKITAAFARQNINFICVRTWDGGRTVERYLKSRHNHSSLCPLCNPKAHKHGTKMNKQHLTNRVKIKLFERG